MDDQQIVDSAEVSKSEDELKFDALTKQKEELWGAIKSRLAHEDIYYSYAHEREPEWKQIVELDHQLLALAKKIKGGR